MSALPNEHLIDTPGNPWEFGTRDTGSYATMTEMVNYFE